MKIKYVGLKDEETAFSPETGITWVPGASHEISAAIAKRMLAHPDVFAEDTGDAAPATVVKTAAPAPTPVPPAGEPPKFVIGTPDGPLVLDNLDRDELWGMANEAGLKPHPKLGEAKLRAMLIERFPLQAA